MKWFPLLLATSLSCLGSGIGTKVIDPQAVSDIHISRSVTTILRFPSQFTGVYGTGLVTGKDQKAKGEVQVSCAPAQKIMVLHALSDIGTQMTVMMSDQMYVFNLIVTDPPDIAVTLEAGAGSVPAVTGESHEATAKEVLANRPHFDDQTLIEIAERAERAELSAAVQPQLYKGYRYRNCQLPSDDGTTKTVVRKIHQFPEFDAIVLEGYIENDGDSPLNFDATHVGVAIGDVQHPIAFLSCQRPVPAHGTQGFLVEVVGDYDGGRAAYSIDNDYRLIINTGYHISEKPVKPNK